MEKHENKYTCTHTYTINTIQCTYRYIYLHVHEIHDTVTVHVHAGVYQRSAQQGVFPPSHPLPPRSSINFFPKIYSKIYKTITFSYMYMYHQFYHCSMCMGSKVWLTCTCRWLLVNPNVKLRLSSPCSAQEGTHPPLTPTHLGCQGSTLVQLSSCSPPLPVNIFGPDRKA